jgi:DNA replication and repair protein RecF
LPARQLEDQLFAWDLKFAELAEQLVTRRQLLVDRIKAEASDVYSVIAKRPHSVLVEYHSSVLAEDYRAGILKLMHARLPHDVERGFTGVGPQRDDFTVYLDGATAAAAASRGEMRSLLLTLKIIELRLLAEQNDATPLLLLDDVFSELDSGRRKALAELAKTYQTLITTTDADAVTEHFTGDYRIITTGK